MDSEVKRQLDLRLAKGEITRDEYSATLKPEVRLFRDGFIEKEGVRINLGQAHSKKMIKLGSSGFFHSSPSEFIFGLTGMSSLSQRITVKVWIDRDVVASIINHLAEGRAI